MRFLSLLLVGLPLAAASVSGVVTNSVTGTPIPRAHVTLEGLIEGQPGRYGATSGADGRFSISGLPAGSYSPSAERIGFVLSAGRGAGRITLKDGDDKNDVEIKLVPTGAVLGRVTDGNGEPLEGANVVAQGARSTESGTSDADGRFRIGGLTPGLYKVMASRSGDVFGGRPEIRTDGTAEVHYAATPYPEKVEVRPAGESTGINIQLVSVPFVRVSGKVVGMPREADRVSVMVWQGAGGQGAGTRPDGSFEIWRLDPGKYTLRAQWTTPAGEIVQTAGTEVEVAGSNIDNIELRVIPDSAISGRLEFEDDQVRQTTTKETRERTITLLQTGANPGDEASARVESDNTFRLEKVQAGKYRVELSWETAYVKSVRLGSTITDGAALDLSNGSGGADLSLVLGPSNGSISGTVNSAGGHVVVRKAQEGSGFVRVLYLPVKADGTYTCTGLAPGDYKVVAVGTDDLMGASAWITEHDDLVEEVEVGPGEKVTKDLKLQQPDAQ